MLNRGNKIHPHAPACRISAGRKDFDARVKTEDVIIFTERFSAMVNAGLSIISSLRALGKQTEDKNLKEIISTIRMDLEGGLTLSDALGKHPQVFSNLYINLVKAGETGGIMDKVLQRMAEYLNKELQLRRRIKLAFSYPVIVLCAAILVVGFLVIFIVPVFIKAYSKMGMDLPLPTIILFGISKFIGSYWWAIAAILVLVVFGYRTVRSQDKFKIMMDRFKLNLPVFGSLNSKIVVSRFIRTFGLLVASGVPIMQSLSTVRGASGNKIMEQIIDNTKEEVSRGKTVTDTLSLEEIIPPMVIQMVSAGEQSGTMDIMLAKTADFLDRDVDNTIQRVVTRLEPLLTVFLAIIVGFIALAIYLPIFDLVTMITK